MRKITLILAGLVVVFACKKSETATSTTTQSTSTQSTSTTVTPAPPPTQPSTATTATTATTASAAPTAGAIASTEGEKSGVKIDIMELKRASGGTVSLRFVIVNNSEDRFSIAGQHLADQETGSDYRSVSGIHLVDPVNKKKYFVVRDAEKNCLCSQNVEDIKAGARASLWAKFPAPPAEVQKVTIEIPHFQPIDDAPISQ